MFNNKGYSIVSVIIASGIVVATVLLIATQYRSNSNIIKNSEKIESVNFSANSIVQKLTSIITDARNNNTQKYTEGLCRFAKASSLSNKPLTGKGVGSINLVFNDKNLNKPYWTNRWLKYLGPDWSKDKSSECEMLNTFSGCFKTNQPKLYGENIKNLIINTKIKVLNIDPDNAKGTFIEISNLKKGKYDIKKTAFEIEVKAIVDLNLNNSNTKKIVTKKELVWGANVKKCNQLNFDLYSSGTGIPDDPNKAIYNSTSYKNESELPVEINFSKVSPVRGQVKNGYISTNVASNVEMACTERRFRCRNVNKKRVFDSDINGQIVAFNNLSTQTEFHPRLIIQKKASNNKLLTNNDQYKVRWITSERDLTNKNQPTSRVSYRLNKWKVRSQNNRSLVLPKGSSQIDIRINDHKGKICQSACQDVSQVYNPRIDYRVGNSKVDYSTSSPSQLMCIGCYTKNCQRLGVGTFGPIKYGELEQPIEPLDSGLPECSIQGSYNLIDNKLNSSAINDNTSSKCISAKFTNSGDLMYTARDCSQKLPVMCYAYGHFLIARDVFKSNQFDKLSFNQAQRRCYEMGREVTSEAKMKQMFTQIYGEKAPKIELPKSSGKVDFINNANQGIFLSPQTHSQIELASKGTQTVNFPSDKEFWVGYQIDENNNVYATLPFVQSKNSKKDHAALIIESPNQIHLKYYPEIYKQYNLDNNGKSAAILLHHVRHKGLFKADENQNKKLPFLCIKTNGNVIKSQYQSHHFKKGQQACDSVNADFIPPQTPLQWVKAFELAANFSSKFAYPDPFSEDIKGIWVGIRFDGNNISPASLFQDKYNFFSTYFTGGNNTSIMNRKGEFVKSYKKAKEEYEDMNKNKKADDKIEPFKYPYKKKVKHILCYSKNNNNFEIKKSEYCGNNLELANKQHIQGWLNKLKLYYAFEKENLNYNETVKVGF